MLYFPKHHKKSLFTPCPSSLEKSVYSRIMKKKGHLLDIACPLDEPLFSSESERRSDRNCFMFVSLWLGDRLST